MTAGWCCRTVRAAVFAAACVLLAALGHVVMSGTPVPWWALAGGGLVTGGAAWCLAGRERGFLTVVSVAVAAQTLLHASFSMAQAVMRPALPGGASFAQQWAQYLLCGSMGAERLPDHEATRVVMDAGLGHHLGSAPPGDASGGRALPDPSALREMEGMGHTSGSGPDPGSSMDMGSMDHMSHMGHAGHAGSMGDHMGSMGDMGSMDSMGHDMAGMSSTGMLAAHLLAALLCGLWLAHGERAAFRILRSLAGWLVAPLCLPLLLPAPPHRPRVRARRGRFDRAPRRLLLVHAITSRGPPAATAVV